MKHFIGLDAHSKTCMFVAVDGRGRQTMAQRVKTGEKTILNVVRSLPGKKALVFEESHLSKWLYTLLQPEVDDLVVCDPAYVARKKGPKDDYPDTLHLAQQLRGNFLERVFHESNFFSELRDEVSAYIDLVRDLVRLKNRYKALFRCEALETEGTKIYSREARIEELSSKTARFVASGLFKRIQIFDEERTLYHKRFNEYAAKYPEIRCLATIPGIAETRATIIAAIVCSPKRFENKFKFWSYCMLVKYDQRSDDCSYGKRQTPGNRILKDVFIGAAESVLQRGSELKRIYDNTRAKGSDHRAAKKNLARKIAAIALAVMKRKSPYKEQEKEET